ncbi:hypothetical protein BDQ17DRAFT_1500343 [Cyathus striatus]|nr:hypothetical protein BDQ17DRAFT_1500343 [Cyathus striatus]
MFCHQNPLPEPLWVDMHHQEVDLGASVQVKLLARKALLGFMRDRHGIGLLEGTKALDSTLTPWLSSLVALTFAFEALHCAIQAQSHDTKQSPNECVQTIKDHREVALSTVIHVEPPVRKPSLSDKEWQAERKKPTQAETVVLIRSNAERSACKYINYSLHTIPKLGVWPITSGFNSTHEEDLVQVLYLACM